MNYLGKQTIKQKSYRKQRILINFAIHSSTLSFLTQRVELYILVQQQKVRISNDYVGTFGTSLKKSSSRLLINLINHI